MNEPDASVASLPEDPTFPPSAYEQLTRLLRGGVIGFFLLAMVGLIADLAQNPSETVSTLLGSTPAAGFASIGVFARSLVALQPSAIIILGVYVMVAVTITRVFYAMVDFYRGGERTLGGLSAVVVLLLFLGLFVLAPFVH